MTDANKHAEQDSTPATPEYNTPENNQDGDLAPGKEYGGPKGLEPTRYGDWEKAGRCIDF